MPKPSGQEKPAWAAELSELIRVVSLQSAHGYTRLAGALLCAGPVVSQATSACGARSLLEVRETPQGLIGGTTQAPSSVSQPVLLPVDSWRATCTVGVAVLHFPQKQMTT